MHTELTNDMKFSQRMGITAIKTGFQADSLDKDLRTRLWNALYANLLIRTENTNSWSLKKNNQLIILIWTDFFMHTADQLSVRFNRIEPDSLIKYMKQWMLEAEYYQVFDLIEYIIPVIEEVEPKAVIPFMNDCNKALEKEGAVYRVVERKVIRIMAGTEVKALEQAAQGATAGEPVNIHFIKALELLAERKAPDYRQAIIEALAAIDESLQYYDADKIIPDPLSPITAYVNNLGSIRQALEEEDLAVTFEAAKYWLVVCAALINYLRATS